jgi:hypothetical protein
MKEQFLRGNGAARAAVVGLVLALTAAWLAPPGRADQAASEVSIGKAARIAGGGGGGGGASGLSFFSLQAQRPVEHGGAVSGLADVVLTDSQANWGG